MGILPSWMDDGSKFAWAASVISEANNLSKPCSALSVGTCALNAGYLGLQFGKSLGFAYMVPFKGEATLIVGYQGFIELALRSEFVTKVSANVVCSDEPFEMWTDESGSHFKHQPNHNRMPSRANINGAYCTYTTKSGEFGFEYVSRKEIDTKSDKNRDVWLSDYSAMCKKTAIRRAAKFWRKSPLLAHAVMVDEQEERGERQAVPEQLVKLLPASAPEVVRLSLEEFEADVMRCKTTAQLEPLQASLDKLAPSDRQTGTDIFDRRYATLEAVE